MAKILITALGRGNFDNEEKKWSINLLNTMSKKMIL